MTSLRYHLKEGEFQILWFYIMALRWSTVMKAIIFMFSSVQSLSHVQLFVTPWAAACQASLSITNSWSLLKLMSIELVMPSDHLILPCPLLLPSIFPSIRVFSNELVLHIRWPKYWSFSLSLFSEYSGYNIFMLQHYKLKF